VSTEPSADPDEYEYDLAAFAADTQGVTTYDSENKVLTIRENGTVYFELPEGMLAGDSINITVDGNWTDTSKGWRSYLTSSSTSVTNVSNISNNGTAFTGSVGESYSQTFTLTATGSASYIAIRGPGGGTINADFTKITSNIIYGDPAYPDPESTDYFDLDLTSQTSQRTNGATTTEDGKVKLYNASTPSGTSGASVGFNLPAEAGTLVNGDSVVVLVKGTVTGESNFDSYRVLLANAAGGSWNSTSTPVNSGYASPRKSPITPGNTFTIIREIKFDVNNTPTCIYFQNHSQGEITLESMEIQVKKATS
jgi:hypothetical protein